MDQQIILYHGSPKVVDRPFLGGGRPNNDYGPGFYCTESIDLACEWARPEARAGFVNKYYLENEGLTVLNLSESPCHALNWLAILLQNRHFYIPQGLASEARAYILSEFLTDSSGFDIINGWRADDSYFSFAKAFLNGSISLEQLSSAMKLGQLGEQIVLKSEKAFERIHYLGATPAPDVYAARRKARDEAAREDFFRLKSTTEPLAGTYILDILRGKWKNDDERLR